ncbi:type II toxin-antitoxin system death-on-curing family toxin [Agathobaculum sp. LCP25S3_E8]|uniref:type II toxin-antitoxin system death-on-curing family toxin n=1 Tax=Agathobaculum sp. LCP25S3_E8 TaxID=3438735 RepID=UPI003F8F62B3
MIWITVDNAIAIHSYVIEKSGGLDGLRDRDILKSAISSPLLSFGGTELIPTDLEEIAKLGFGLAANHAFLDANKRIGAMMV